MANLEELTPIAKKFLTAFAQAVRDNQSKADFHIEFFDDRYGKHPQVSGDLPETLKILAQALDASDFQLLDRHGYLNEIDVMQDDFSATAFYSLSLMGLESVGEREPSTSRKHIFLSYAHSNLDDNPDSWYKKLAPTLRQAGFTLWIDTENLPYGVDWRQEIDNAIRSAIALIIIVTPESRKSEYVTYEWAFAVGAQVPVIPILAKGQKMHPRLEAIQYMKISELDDTGNYGEKLIKHLQHLRKNSSR